MVRFKHLALSSKLTCAPNLIWSLVLAINKLGLSQLVQLLVFLFQQLTKGSSKDAPPNPSRLLNAEHLYSPVSKLAWQLNSSGGEVSTNGS